MTDPYCPVCGPTTLDRIGRCALCDKQVTTPPATRTKSGRNANRGAPVLMDNATIERAAEMHDRGGMSLRAIARELLPTTGYASAGSLTEALRVQLRHRGYFVRDRRTATVAAHLVHGKLRRAHRDPGKRHEQRVARGEVRGVRCLGVRQQYPRKGERCQLPAVTGSDYCHNHDPTRDEQRRAEMAALRDRRQA